MSASLGFGGGGGMAILGPATPTNMAAPSSPIVTHRRIVLAGPSLSPCLIGTDSTSHPQHHSNRWRLLPPHIYQMPHEKLMHRTTQFPIRGTFSLQITPNSPKFWSVMRGPPRLSMSPCSLPELRPRVPLNSKKDTRTVRSIGRGVRSRIQINGGGAQDSVQVDPLLPAHPNPGPPPRAPRRAR